MNNPADTGLNPSRYLAVSRRSILTAIAAAAAGGSLAACSNGDQQALGGDSAAAAGATNTASMATPGATRAPSASAVATSAQLTIDFTFTAGQDGGGPARNPYIAVWIETPDEQLVTTIALWHLQQNERWLGELKRWYGLAAGDGASVSSATRVPGEYSLQWDCTDASGVKVPQGEYYVCIEGSRERGPYELIREPITLSTTPVQQVLEPSGELTMASVNYQV